MRRRLRLFCLTALATLAPLCEGHTQKYAYTEKTELSPAQQALCTELQEKQVRLQAKKVKIEKELIALEEKQLRSMAQ